MQFMKFFTASMLLGLVAVAFAQQPEQLKILAQYQGTVANEKKPKLKTGFIATSQDWERVWKIINPQAKTPKVDFKKHFLIIETQDPVDPNRRSTTITKNDKGIVSVQSISTLIGFEPSNQTQFTFFVVSRAGVRGVQRFDPENRKIVVDPLPKPK